MTNTHSIYLKEMGITQWASRDRSEPIAETLSAANNTTTPREEQLTPSISQGVWWFFGNEPQGDAQLLFQNMIRVLGLAKNQWAWKNPADDLSKLTCPDAPIVAVALGGAVAQKITGEREPLAQLRETILAINTGNDEEIPVIASFELNQVLTKPKDKAMLWQDLLLARSVLQNG
jgi:DNA polymerase III psi subunit